MKADQLKLAALCAQNPALSAALQTADFGMAALSNVNMVDKTYASMANSIIDFLNQCFLVEGSLPFTIDVFRPVAGIIWPAEMNVGVNDVVVPIRFLENAVSNGITPVNVATIDPTIRFGNNTVSGAINVDVFALSFNGQVMSGFSRRGIMSPLGGANSSAEGTILAAQRAGEAITDVTTGVATLNAQQSSGFYKLIQLLPIAGNLTPAAIGNAIDYGTIVGASFSGFLKPYTLAVVFRSLGTVTADVTISLGIAGPTSNKDIVNKILQITEESLT